MSELPLVDSGGVVLELSASHNLLEPAMQMSEIGSIDANGGYGTTNIQYLLAEIVQDQKSKCT